jgi:hypothetical protein
MAARTMSLFGRRRRRHDQLATQACLFVVGVVVVVFLGEAFEGALGRVGSGAARRALQEGEEGLNATTAAANASDPNTCGLDWSLDLWACVCFCGGATLFVGCSQGCSNADTHADTQEYFLLVDSRPPCHFD